MKTLKLATTITFFANYAVAGGMPEEMIEPLSENVNNNLETTLASAVDGLAQFIEFAFMALFIVL